MPNDAPRFWLRRLGRDFALVLLTAGLLLAASPPRSLWPLGLLGLILLHPLLADAGPGRAALLGWAVGFLVNLGGHAWGPALLERFAGVGRPAAAALAVAFAAYQALVFLLGATVASLLRRYAGLAWYVAAPLTLALAETAVPMVFPWHLGVFVWRAWPLLQIAELGGPSAVSALALFVAALLGEAAAALLARRPLSRDLGRAALFGLLVLGLGLGRAYHIARLRAQAPSLLVAVVQPNVGLLPMQERDRRGGELITRLRAATERAIAQGAELVIWPESAFPYLFDRQLDREYAPGHPWELRTTRRGRLLAGALTHQFGGGTVENSAVLIAADGRIQGFYAKTELVPFGEFVPLRQRFPAWAERVRKRLPASPEIVPGTGPSLLTDDTLRIGPLICVEELLPEHVLETARLGPNLLVTLANHAWFGASAAPSQALALSTLASVATRRDLVRATSTGISSFGDALGRVTDTSASLVSEGTEATPEVLLHRVALLETPALAPRVAWFFPYGCALALLALGAHAWRRRYSSSRR
ncbi:MAG TPA: apolipoprotein N-acyltransferase [Polyangia bacterium]|jgi:apolipoprotein N-acyltransferase|nr:apolipoprotein N-acyltransferase [Polyangia bacterium]